MKRRKATAAASTPPPVWASRSTASKAVSIEAESARRASIPARVRSARSRRCCMRSLTESGAGGGRAGPVGSAEAAASTRPSAGSSTAAMLHSSSPAERGNSEQRRTGTRWARLRHGPMSQSSIEDSPECTSPDGAMTRLPSRHVAPMSRLRRRVPMVLISRSASRLRGQITASSLGVRWAGRPLIEPRRFLPAPRRTGRPQRRTNDRIRVFAGCRTARRGPCARDERADPGVPAVRCAYRRTHGDAPRHPRRPGRPVERVARRPITTSGHCPLTDAPRKVTHAALH